MAHAGRHHADRQRGVRTRLRVGERARLVGGDVAAGIGPGQRGQGRRGPFAGQQADVPPQHRRRERHGEGIAIAAQVDHVRATAPPAIRERRRQRVTMPQERLGIDRGSTLLEQHRVAWTADQAIGRLGHQ